MRQGTVACKTQRRRQHRGRLVEIAKGGIGHAKMELHQRVIGQAARGGFQRRQRLGIARAPIGDPAIGVLIGRLIRSVQPPRDGIGAVKAGRIVAARGDQAGEVVGHDHVAAVFGIKRLVDRDGPVNIAGLFKAARLYPAQGAGFRLGHKAGRQHGIRVALVFFGHQQGVKRVDRRFGGRGLADQAAIDLFGLGRIAGRGIEVGRQQAQIGVLRGFGKGRIDVSARLGGLAFADLGLHDDRHRRDVRRAVVDKALQEGDAVIALGLAKQQGGLHAVGGFLRLGRLDRAEGGQTFLHLRPVLVDDAHLGQRRQQRHRGRCHAQRVVQHAFGRRPALGLGQIAGIAQRFRGRLARHIDGLRQLFASQFQIAVAFLRGGHQGQDRGIARVLVHRRAQIDDGLAGLVGGNQPVRPHLQRLDIGRVFGQDLFDPGPGPDQIAGGFHHLGQHRLDRPGLVGRLRRAQDIFQRGDGFGRLAGIEIHRPHQRPVKVGLGLAGIGLGQAVKFGPCGVRPLGALQKLHHGDMRGSVVGGGVGQLAHEGLGPGGVAGSEIPRHQTLLDLRIVGVKREHRLKLRADGRAVLGLHQKAQLEHVEFQRFRIGLQPGFDIGRCRLWRVGHDRRINHDAARHQIVGGGLQQTAGIGHLLGRPGGVLGQKRLAVVQRQIQRNAARVLGVERKGGAAMAFRLGPVAARDGHFGQGLPRFDRVGILLDHPQILAVSLFDLAALEHQPGIGQAGILVKAVVFENIAEFDQSPVDIACLQKRETLLIIAFGLVMRAFAGRSGKGKGQHQDGQQGAKAFGHERTLHWTKAWAGLARFAQRCTGLQPVARSNQRKKPALWQNPSQNPVSNRRDFPTSEIGNVRGRRPGGARVRAKRPDQYPVPCRTTATVFSRTARSVVSDSSAA